MNPTYWIRATLLNDKTQCYYEFASFETFANWCNVFLTQHDVQFDEMGMY